MSKYRKKKKIIAGLLAFDALVLAAASIGKISVDKLNKFQQDESNDIFSKSKVVRSIDYYGGDYRYIQSNYNILTPFTIDKTVYCNHLYTDGSPIIVGYDKNTVSAEEAKQFDYTFNHINKLFSVINPKYKFKTGFYDKSNCDIYVDFSKMPKSADGIVAAHVQRKFDLVNSNEIKSATIHFNEQVEFGSPELRYYMLHEMMHVLYGSKDVDWQKSTTFSLYNYNDVNYVIKQISCAYESKEAYENGDFKYISGLWSSEGYFGDLINIGGFKPHYPIMSFEEKNSFVCLLPTDVSTLIAIYGDSTTRENREKYINLLREVLSVNQNIFDIKKDTAVIATQPYYDDDFELPTP